MDIILQLVLTITVLSMLYGLMVVSFSLIYSVSKVLHLAHGAVVLAAAFSLIWSQSRGYPLVVGILLALCVAVILGVGCNSLVYERMRASKTFSTTGALIAALALLLFLQGATLALFGSSTKTFSLIDNLPSWNVAGAIVSAAELIVIVVSATMLIGLSIFLKKTRLGTAMRAVADHEVVSETIGINIKKVRTLTYAIGSLCAGVAGILFLLRFSIEPTQSVLVAIRMFTRAVIGGVGSLGGGLIASFAIDSVENIGAWYINTTFKEVFALAIAFAILIIKPHGLFGRK